jgi:two-component system response regulator YesN
VNLLIVDDEKTTRESLKNLIPWLELGIDRVEMARNGLDALTLTETFHPDLLLTDVRMPRMNGIELANRIVELFPTCITVFISAHLDKEYLKSAIQLQAFDYIEKPFDAECIIGVFRKALQKSISEKHKAAEEVSIRKNLAEHGDLLCQEFLLALLDKRSTVDELFGKYRRETVKLPLTGVYGSAVSILDWHHGNEHTDRIGMRSRILHVVNRDSGSDRLACMGGFIDDSTLFFILGGADGTEEAHHRNCDGLLSEMLVQCGDTCRVTIGYSGPVQDLSRVADADRSSFCTSRLRFYGGTNRVYDCSEASVKSGGIDPSAFSGFAVLLKKDSPVPVANFIGRLEAVVSASRDPDVDKIKNLFFKLVLQIFAEARHRMLLDQLDDSESRYLWQEFSHFVTLKELVDFIHLNLDIVFRRFNDQQSSNRTLNEIVHFISENLKDKDLGVQSVASHVHLSSSYLCAFFKKNRKLTLSDYIYDARIERAKHLLSTTGMKLYEVAEEIGLTDANYFSTYFKKHEGCTPSSFRNQA